MNTWATRRLVWQRAYCHIFPSPSFCVLQCCVCSQQQTDPQAWVTL
ncbi:hypothetical protein LEMLEM_LOCUS20000 [Lemmus lemmus]